MTHNARKRSYDYSKSIFVVFGCKKVLSRLVLKRKCLTMNQVVFFYTKANRITDLIIMITRFILNVFTSH